MNTMSTGERIRALRIQKGFSQEELGIRVGLKKAAINKYETGVVVNLKRSVIAKLADVLETSPAYLMGWDYNEKDISQELLDTMEDISFSGENRIGSTDKKTPTPVSRSGLSAEQLELVNLFESAPPALRSAALAVLRSAEGQSKAPGGSSEAE